MKKEKESNIQNWWDNMKCANLHIIGVPEGVEREREGNWKCIWRNYGWKHPKSKNRNTYPGTGNTESPKQDEPKQTHTKTYHN